VTDDRLTVRRAVESDDGALLALDHSAWDSRSGFPSFSAEVRETFFNERSSPEAHLVAEYDGEYLDDLGLAKFL
jgi:hypothetical protein